MPIINDAKMLLDRVHQWRVRHVRREANGAAHCLAKRALSCTEEEIWRGTVPDCIHQIINAEAFNNRIPGMGDAIC